MNLSANMMLGVFCLLYSIVAAVVYLVRPHTFTKLEHFQKLYGKVRGTAIHVLFYCIGPMILGIVLIFCR